jgi:hypothetical protein
MENLGATIEKAVDAAVSASSTPGQESTPASTTPSSADSPAADSLPAAPASGAGLAPETSTTATPDQATTRPADDDDGILRDDAKWLTLDKRRTILTNAREKAAAAERNRVYQDFGIRDTDRPDAVAQHVRALLEDPVAYHASLGDRLRRQGLLKDESPAPAAPDRQAPRASRSIRDFALPPATLATSDGKGVYTTDDVQALVSNLLEHFEQVVEGRLEPHERSLAEQREVALWTEADRLAHNDIAGAQKWPRWNDVSKRVGQLMRQGVERKDTSMTLRNAYNEAFVELSLTEAPTMEARLRARLAEEAQRHPAGDIAQPGAPVVQERQVRRSRTLNDDISAAVDRAARLATTG